MKDIFYSVLFLIIEVGAFMFFGTHHALTGGFTIILLILIAKNIFVLYTSLKKDKPQEAEIQQAAGTPSAGAPLSDQTAFSDGSLARIERALAEATIANPLFRYTASAERLTASYGYGEGMDVYSDGTLYICEYHRERSNDLKYEDSEEAAVSRFIRGCQVGMVRMTR